jgi:4-hydroxybenzoate polyprenyltransferase
MVKNFFNLVRWKNLLITGGLVLILKFVVFETAIQFGNNSFPLSVAQFSISQTVLLILSLIFLAAAGYIINDIYDVKTDHINKPDKVVIGVSISAKAATNLFYICNLIGIGLGVYLGYKMGNYQIGLLHGVVAMVFWIYSVYLKGTILIGNIIIAFASSTVPLIYFGFEGYAYIKKYGDILAQNFGNYIGGPNEVLFYYCLILSIFAFIISLAREIVKDIEDRAGDFATGSKTFPIVFGNNVAKYTVQFLILVCIVLVVWLLHFKLANLAFINLFFSTYTYLTIIFPALYLIILLYKANRKEDYGTASLLLKFIMVSGIATTFIYASNV